ncbi:hypothetical protein VTK56DRAFT_2679 [Thermocarpiscus australiensis]
MTIVFPIERQSQRAVIGVATVFTSLAIIACALRALARRLARRPLDSSDWCIFAACFVTAVYQAINITSMSPLLSLLPDAARVTRLTGQGVLICGVGFHFAEIMQRYGQEPITIFLKATLCVQLGSNHPGGHCGNQVLSYQVTGALNLVTDLIVLVLPMPYLYGLNMALYKKLVLMATFAVGLFTRTSTCVVSGLRLVALSSIDYADITFNIPESLVFSGLEPFLAVTLACVPVLQPLLGTSRVSSRAPASAPGSSARARRTKASTSSAGSRPSASSAPSATIATWKARPENKAGNIIV